MGSDEGMAVRIAERRRRIGILLFDGVTTLDFVGPSEVFHEANTRTGDYELVFLSADGSPVVTSMGLRIAVDAAAADSGSLDTLIVPGGEATPDIYDTAEFSAALSSLIARSRRVASVCSGAFALASLGMLDGRAATTHWKFTEQLAATYPAIAVEPDAIFVRSGDVFSSAGVAAGIDLALALVEEDHGADIAHATARTLLVYLRRSGGQSQFSAPLSAGASRTRTVRSIADYVAADPTRPCTLRDLAGHANVSTRHLTRVVREELGMTPTEYVNSMRLDRARTLLESGHAVRTVAEVAGYSSPVALRRAFTARFKLTPSAYQRSFRNA